MLPRGWAALVVVAVLATSARAQVSDELGIERFRVAMDRRGVANVEWADVPAHLHWDAGILVGFAHAPLVLYDREMMPVASLVERRLTTTLVGAIGLYDRVQLGVSADVVGYQSGADAGASPTKESLPSAGLGDVRLVAKSTLARSRHYQVGLLATATIPAGSGNGFLREAGVTFAPALVVSSTFGAGRAALNAGYLFRPDTTTAGLTSGDEPFVRAALAFRVAEPAEVFTAVSYTGRDAVEAFGGGSYRVSPAIDVMLGVGVGLNSAFGIPQWRGLVGLRFGSAPGAPIEVPIVRVVTPELPKDTDGDGVLDGSDKCAGEKEVVNGLADDDGCAEKPVALTMRVVDPDGRPIRGASVVVTEAATGATATLVADEDGRITHPILGGAITLVATAPEYQEGTAQVTIEPGTPGSATVTLVRKVRQGQLRGQVLSFDGKPLAATIKVNGASVTADGEGTFSVDLPAGTFTVEISAAGYATQKRSIKIKLDGVTVLNVDLRGAK